MTDFIRNQPRSGALGSLSDALDWVRNKANYLDLANAPGTPLGAVARAYRALTGDNESTKLGNMVAGHAPEEVNEWAYGNSPFTTLGNMPVPRQDRASGLLDTLSLAPLVGPLAQMGKGVAKSAAHIAETELGRVSGTRASQRGVVRLKGGNFSELAQKDFSDMLGPWSVPAINSWKDKQLMNYMTKDFGSTTDPLRSLQAEYPDLHMPEGYLSRGNGLGYLNAATAQEGYDAMRAAGKKFGDTGVKPFFNDRHDMELAQEHFALTDQPLTPWDAMVHEHTIMRDPQDYADTIREMDRSRAPPAWLAKAPPDTKIMDLMSQDGDPMHFSHVLDYLKAATEPYEKFRNLNADKVTTRPYVDVPGAPPFAPYRHVHSPESIKAGDDMVHELARNGENADAWMAPFQYTDMRKWIDLHNAGLTMTPEQLQRTSVADAVKKTAQWNKWMADRQAENMPDLALGHVVHKEYYPEGTLFHGGSYAPGAPIEGRLYATPDRTLAESYIDMHDGRFGPGGKLSAMRAEVNNPAPPEIVARESNKIGLDNGDYTPASAFDHNLHDPKLVDALIGNLKGLGYDHSVLPDIGFGIQRDGLAHVLFPGTRTESVQPNMKWVKFQPTPLEATAEDLSKTHPDHPYFSEADPVKKQRLLQDIRDNEGDKPLSRGLNAEGEAMGHCVGGYCDDVAERGTQIYSLRDAKGNPHVTVEVSPRRFMDRGAGQQELGEDFWDHVNDAATRRGINDPDFQTYMAGTVYDYTSPKIVQDAMLRYPALKPDIEEYLNGVGVKHDIQQIKGKGNEAPVDKYLPYVQDFVKSGNWGRVRDLENTGLYQLGSPSEAADASLSMFSNPDMPQSQRQRLWVNYHHANPDVKYATKQDVLDWFKDNPTAISDYDKAPGE